MKSKFASRGSWTTKKVVRRRSAATKRISKDRISTVSAKRKALINVQGGSPLTRGRELHWRGLVIGAVVGANRNTGVPLYGVESDLVKTSHINTIPVGSTLNQRVGRMINLHRLSMTYTISSGQAGYGALARVAVVFDKRPQKNNALEWDDVFSTDAEGSSMINAMMRETSDGQFEVLYDKTTFVEGGRPYELVDRNFPAEEAGIYPIAPLAANELLPNGTEIAPNFWGARNAVFHQEVIDLTAKRFYTQYAIGGVDGEEADIEYGSLHLFAWSDIGSDVAENPANRACPFMNMRMELEFTDK